MAQDFWTMAKRSFSLFWCASGTTLQVESVNARLTAESDDDVHHGSATV